MECTVVTTSQLSEHLRAFRKLRGLTQAQVAVHLGVTQSRFAKIERNPGTTSTAQVMRLLGILGVRLTLAERIREQSGRPATDW